MSADLTIIRAGPAQLDDACCLFAGYLSFYGKHSTAQAQRDFIAVRLNRRDSVIFLAYEADTAIGFMQLYPSFASLSLAPSWILNDLYVDESARGRGVAEALERAARGLGEENGAAEIFLQTARDNHVAQRLYQRLGYRRDDEFLVYTLSLPTP